MKPLTILNFIIILAFLFSHCKASSIENLSIEEMETRCMILRSRANEFIEKERPDDALKMLDEASKHVGSVFSICKVCELLYRLRESERALELLRQVPVFKLFYIFEIHDAVGLLEKHHREQEELISYLKSKILLSKKPA